MKCWWKGIPYETEQIDEIKSDQGSDEDAIVDDDELESSESSSEDSEDSAENQP